MGSVSVANKAAIHFNFKNNSNWTTDWSSFIGSTPLTDSNFKLNTWFSDEAYAIATYGHISDWNVSGVTDMNEAFFGQTNFNEDIGGWDVSSVTSMARMFHGASSFDQPIKSWDISNVTSLQGMFKDASTFNQSLSEWNVSSVSRFDGMFTRALAFNHNIGDWNTSSATHGIHVSSG